MGSSKRPEVHAVELVVSASPQANGACLCSARWLDLGCLLQRLPATLSAPRLLPAEHKLVNLDAHLALLLLDQLTSLLLIDGCLERLIVEVFAIDHLDLLIIHVSACPRLLLVSAT